MLVLSPSFLILATQRAGSQKETRESLIAVVVNKGGRTFAAGVLSYGDHDIIHSRSSSSGSISSQTTLTWSSLASAPAGYVADVQILRPGARKWAPWKQGVTLGSGVFTPDADAGAYGFRARLRRLSNGAASAWSPQLTIMIA